MVTIYDIAKQSGFSAPTVSKALNGTGSLNEKTREKIKTVAQEMGYEMNLAAKTLTTKKSKLIGVIYEDSGMLRGFDHPVFAGVLNKLRSELEKAGYDILFLSRSFNMSYLNHARLRSVDGVAIINPNDHDSVSLRELAASGIPCISTNDYLPGVCTILTDNERGGYQGTQYLVTRGHRKIAFLAGPMSTVSAASLERYEGFRKCLEDNGIAFEESLFEECSGWDSDSGYEGFARIYRRQKDFTALFASDDLLAYGAMRFASEHGISVPSGLSVVGFDDDRISSYSVPKLTTFRQNREQIGEKAAQILLSIIKGSTAPEILRLPAELLERDSVARLV